MKLKSSVFDHPLVFVDIETTGLRPTYDRIIEIGIVKVINGEIVQKFNSLINPNIHLPAEIIQITGITTSDLENAPSWRLVQDEVLELLKDAIFVAHNARFDYGFIKNEFRRSNLSFSTKPLCSAKLSRALFPRFRRHNLDSLIERFNLDCTNRHRAYDDAHVIYQFFKSLDENFDKPRLFKTIEGQLKKPSLPQNLKQSDLDNLPEKPGVYIFYGSSGAPL
jgi:DNA polymerase III subunit epsilon